MLKVKHFIIFLVINFGGLALGNFLMNNEPQSSWYAQLEKAPWTPPGWVFFAKNNQKRRLLYAIQVMLNVSWNYIFFNQHQVFVAQIGITLLTALIFYFFFTFFNEQKSKSVLLLPYMVWLCIATSLNLYILVNN